MMKPRYIFLRMATTLVILIAIVTAGFIIFAHKDNSASNGQKLQIVAAENFWGNIISQIGGKHVEVTSIITDPSTDPHLYESDAHDAAALSGASIVIKNGLGYDDFMDKLLSTSTNDQRTVLSVNKILKITGNNPNPHLWYNVPRVPEVAASFEKALIAKDPAHAADYKANLTAFDNSLQPILSVIRQIKTKYTHAPVAYTERVAGYLLDAAGLDVKTPAGFAAAVEDGNDPSPADTATMDTLMTNRSARALLYNTQATSSVTQHAQDLARQAGIPVIGVTETLPKNEPTYQSWQLHQAQAIVKALGD